MVLLLDVLHGDGLGVYLMYPFAVRNHVGATVSVSIAMRVVTGSLRLASVEVHHEADYLPWL